MTYSGGFGDYECDISFVHAKDLLVSTNDINNTTTKAAVSREQKRPSKTSDSSYTVKSGYNLWDIAQLKLGSGNRYMEIVKLNNLSNPDKIQLGQNLILPDK